MILVIAHLFCARCSAKGCVYIILFNPHPVSKYCLPLFLAGETQGSENVWYNNILKILESDWSQVILIAEPTLFFLNWRLVDLQCCVNFCPSVKWFSSIYVTEYIHMFFFIFFSIVIYLRILNVVPCTIQCSRTLLFIHPIYNVSNLHMLILNSQSILHPWQSQVCSVCESVSAL